VIFITALLHERDPGVLGTHLHRQGCAAGADGEGLIAQLPGQIKRLQWRLLTREPQRVLGHLRLDARAHRGGGPEEPVGGRQSPQPLVRALEVVVLDKKPHAPMAVLEVREHRAREKLLPQGLPEPLDLPAGLRMMRPALHMLDAVALQLRLELRAAAPGGVLAALIGEDLPRRPVLGNPTAQRFQHQHASLVVRHRQTHQIPGVIVQKGRNVDAFMAAQQEREQIRLPQLVGLRPLEVLHDLLASYPAGHDLRRDAFAPQHPTHRGLGGAKAQKSLHQIPDAASPGLRLLRVRRQHGGGYRTTLTRRSLARERALLAQCRRAAFPKDLHPLHRGRVWHAQAMRDFVRVQSAFHHRPNYRFAYLGGPGPPSSRSILGGVPRCARLLVCVHLSTPSPFVEQLTDKTSAR
jgi:hypothetical protein